MKNLLAFDLGASNGRAILGQLEGDRLTMRELHRFENNYIEMNGVFYWDLPYLYNQLKQGLLAFKHADVGELDCFGIDTWGVDYGLLDKNGHLLNNPRAYRMAVDEDMENVWKTVDFPTLFARTGIATMNFNTVYQLYRRKLEGDVALENAETLLLMPDLLGYFLTGEKKSEYTEVTTSMLYNPGTKDWDWTTIDELGLPRGIFTGLDRAGSLRGRLRKDIADEIGINRASFAAVGTHDTASAVAAIPGEGSFAFCSSGTWSLFGTELDKPIVNETSLNINITNEGGFDDSTGFLKNIIGLWLIQESRRQWQRQGEDYSYADLEKLALAAEPFKCFIDPDAPEFVPHGNIPKRVQEFCEKTGQYVPQTVGEIMRCIYESLAMKYKLTFEKLRECTERDYPVIHVIGGGTKDGLLCQLTANSCSRTVKAGPIEATVMGNIAVQLMSDGSVEGIGQARKIVADSSELKTYEPIDTDKWEEAYADFLKIV